MTHSDFRAAIRAELERRGMSVAELARVARVHRPRVTQWLNGDIPGVSSTTLQAIVIALDLALGPAPVDAQAVARRLRAGRGSAGRRG